MRRVSATPWLRELWASITAKAVIAYAEVAMLNSVGYIDRSSWYEEGQLGEEGCGRRLEE